jgi:hypothetical protein
MFMCMALCSVVMKPFFNFHHHIIKILSNLQRCVVSVGAMFFLKQDETDL